MKLIDVVFSVAIVAAIISLGAMGAWAISNLIDAYFHAKLRQRFLTDLQGAVRHSQPSWEQVVQMAQSRGLTQRQAFFVARSLLRDVLTGVEADLGSYRALLESYIERYEATQPFEDLPSETRVHLERLREVLDSKSHLLEPLVIRIRELVSLYERDKARQRFYTISAWVMGLISLLFAAFTYFVPYTLNSDPIAHAAISGQSADRSN